MIEEYELIKRKWGDFLLLWQMRRINGLEKIISKACEAYFSTTGTTPDGSQHSLYGVGHFIADTPPSDYFDYEVCHYVCRYKEDQAQQHALVLCQANISCLSNNVLSAGVQLLP